jgi:plasmid maintenance system antidote protein VapI
MPNSANNSLFQEDYLNPLGLSITEAAKGLDISQKQLSQIVNAKLESAPQWP